MKKTMNVQKRAKLVIHPIRLRIITLLTGKELTSLELASRLPEVPQATLYRHIKQLEEGRIIRITRTNQVRGTVEKVYTAGPGESSHFGVDDIKQLSQDEHTALFASFIAGLYEQFLSLTGKIEQHPELLEVMGYGTIPVRMNPADLPLFQQEFGHLLQRYVEKTPSSDDSREAIDFAFTTILFPEADHESQSKSL
ncbi:MAG: helix-turn-helix domain-containing protein [Spirochaeta sp.]|jgi:DNA-binding transcriptional ArsR family regulator|nr:helix-turn-helix domain-containing protein [Spirochaeta sp.]